MKAKTIRWENAKRWYEIELACDLLGDWIIHQRWGSKFTRLHGRKTHLIKDEDDACRIVERIEFTRARRRPKYWRVYT